MNIYEQWTYDALEKAGFAVFTPIKDRGVDCVVIGKDFRGRPQRIQIKGSRTYEGGSGSWFQFTKAKLEESTKITDFFVFVWTKQSSKGRLLPQFLVVPTVDLYNRLSGYGRLSAGRYHFYPWDEDANVYDTRNWSAKRDGWPPTDLRRDFTPYLNAWSQIRDRL